MSKLISDTNYKFLLKTTDLIFGIYYLNVEIVIKLLVSEKSN